MIKFCTGEESFSAVTPFQILGNFLLLGLVSIFIGIFYGLLASFLFKKLRFIKVSAVRETVIIFSFGYLAYATGDILNFSGIIAQLTSGVVMAHYAWYNLSSQGKVVSSIMI